MSETRYKRRRPVTAGLPKSIRLLKYPGNFTLQMTGDYTSKTVFPPGGTGGAGGGGGGRGGTVSGNAQGYSLADWGR